MPLLGEKQDHTAEDEAARAMFDWVNSASPADLAAELMPAFNSAGPGGGKYLTRKRLAEWLFRGYPRATNYVMTLVLPEQAGPDPVLEAVQMLEHADLIVLSRIGDVKPIREWSATRLSLATIADGKAAVRQRIKDRTGL